MSGQPTSVKFIPQLIVQLRQWLYSKTRPFKRGATSTEDQIVVCVVVRQIELSRQLPGLLIYFQSAPDFISASELQTRIKIEAQIGYRKRVFACLGPQAVTGISQGRKIATR